MLILSSLLILFTGCVSTNKFNQTNQKQYIDINKIKNKIDNINTSINSIEYKINEINKKTVSLDKKTDSNSESLQNKLALNGDFSSSYIGAFKLRGKESDDKVFGMKRLI